MHWKTCCTADFWAKVKLRTALVRILFVLKFPLLLDDCQEWVDFPGPLLFLRADLPGATVMKRAPAQPIQLKPDQIRAIESAVFDVVEKCLDPRFYLIDTSVEKEAGYWYLRIYVEGRDFAISLSDCESISRALDAMLENLPVLQNLSYSLEVSSPGLFRPLRKLREFEFYKGRSVRIEEHGPAPAKKTAKPEILRSEEGLLYAFDDVRRVVLLKKPEQEAPVEVVLPDNAVVCLNPEIHFPDDAEETAKEG
jgi:ribosome maturation factor RimP